ncbi:MAG: isochorismate synthase [Sulfobacillus thermotolerans]|uniref:isochorismate synthase n=1 Tax=Sulfobacillus thermotolerans TaxID=338644 RepID=A0ABN5H0D7_9FIRM|nr:hypothetical protein BXT84_09755 [Sulfobacillus thermotolerans]MCY0907580.1 isochorismate synthase [Sulfobacillus thermotolerans]
MNTHSVTESTSLLEFVAAAWEHWRYAPDQQFWQKEFDYPAVDLPMALQDTADGWYFAHPQGQEQCGLGAAMRWQTTSSQDFIDMERERLKLLAAGLSSKTTLGGGFAFDASDSHDEAWAAFGHARWVLPALYIHQSEGQAHIVVTVYPKHFASAQDAVQYYGTLWAAVDRPQRPDSKDPVPVLSQNMIPPSSQWMALVEEATAAIQQGLLHKVVVARRVDTTFAAPLAVGHLLHTLHHHNPSTTIFGLRAQGQTFLGATPELLLSIHDHTLETMALAGTTARQPSASADAHAAQMLMNSAKNRREHDAVVNRIVDTLRPYADLHVPQAPQILTLANVHHLWTPIQGGVRGDQSLWSLALKLHPTPAVGGEPRTVAQQWLRTHEGLDRGWYAGSVGTMDLKGQGSLWVALRSALVAGNRASCYAGCGIMHDSDPHKELEESEWKLQAMLNALGVKS